VFWKGESIHRHAIFLYDRPQLACDSMPFQLLVAYMNPDRKPSLIGLTLVLVEVDGHANERSCLLLHVTSSHTILSGTRSVSLKTNLAAGG